jgi:hypothetical protein
MKVKSSRSSDPRTQRVVVPFLLSVRPRLTWWQAVQCWLRGSWQRLRAPRVPIQPPLQPARHKPFPQRPHQQRRQAVFAALDAAPAGLTRRQLIAHVRAITGIGCSEKLITQWRQAQQNANAKGRKGDGETGRGSVIGLLMCLCLNACATTTTTIAPPTPEVTISPAASEAPTIPNLQSPISNPASPRLLRIKLTINAARDLLVKTDDEVKAGQALTNRSHERNRLFAQRRVLETQAQQIEAQLTTAAESLALLEQRGANLPPISFASEQAAITKAEAEAAVTTRQVELQRQKVSGVRDQVSASQQAAFPSHLTPDTWHLIAAHETAKLTFVQDAARQAAAEIALQKAKLTSAQEARAWQEKQHSLELSKQLLTARQQQQQAVLARSQLLSQLTALDLQLAQLAAVRAPFSGKIKRIEYEDMHDQTITVLLYLAVHQ